MRSDELDRALGATPRSFADRMDRTLLELKEEKEVKRFAFRTVLIIALVTALLGTTAFALVSQGLEWYYSNRFTAYRELEPEKYAAIMDNLQEQPAQTPVDDPQVRIAVTEVSWAREQNVLVVSLEASAADPEHTELHPRWNLDADGSYVGKKNLAPYADDEEARTEHWLWTEAGYGPVAEMVAPGKQLLLLETGSVCLGELPLLGDGSSMDAYVAEDGTVHTVLEIRLAEGALDAAAQADAVTLRIPYTVTPYTEDDEQLCCGGRSGEVQFELKIR